MKTLQQKRTMVHGYHENVNTCKKQCGLHLHGLLLYIKNVDLYGLSEEVSTRAQTGKNLLVYFSVSYSCHT